ncbi:MAG: hypothetical protein ABSG73_09030 [Candidatus Aminicenantales bacterium]|jgi:hypothetical protein
MKKRIFVGILPMIMFCLGLVTLGHAKEGTDTGYVFAGHHSRRARKP